MPAADGGQAYMRKVLRVRCLAAGVVAPSLGASSRGEKHLARPFGISEKMSIFAQFYTVII